MLYIQKTLLNFEPLGSCNCLNSLEMPLYTITVVTTSVFKILYNCLAYTKSEMNIHRLTLHCVSSSLYNHCRTCSDWDRLSPSELETCETGEEEEGESEGGRGRERERVSE